MNKKILRATPIIVVTQRKAFNSPGYSYFRSTRIIVVTQRPRRKGSGHTSVVNSYHHCYSTTINRESIGLILKSQLISLLLLNVYGGLDAHKKTKCKLISSLLVEKRTVHVNYRSTHIAVVIQRGQ